MHSFVNQQKKPSPCVKTVKGAQTKWKKQEKLEGMASVVSGERGGVVANGGEREGGQGQVGKQVKTG